jgi:hypothetical protein
MLFSLTFSYCSVFAQRFVPQDIGNFLNQRCEIERFSNIIHDAQKRSNLPLVTFAFL